MTDLLNFFTAQTHEMVALLQQLVEMESPSYDKGAVDRLGAFVADQVRRLGAQVAILTQEERGDHLLARWGEGEGGFLLLCHMDTVWPVGTLAGRPVRIEEELLYGPGAYDMKGGIAITLTALAGLRTMGRWPERPVTALFTSDEEVGSLTSRPLIEVEATRSGVVFCMEPALANGALKTWRKGTGRYKVTTTGRAAHAGSDHEQGVNAIEELAHHILTLQGMTDYTTGTTVSVGVVRGGTRTNVVPDHAEALVDFRVPTRAEGERMVAALEGLRPHLAGASVTVEGGLSRPPMERTPLMVEAFEQARRIGAGLGLQLKEGGSGGASDANFTAALSVPTLDGLGAVGDGAHAVEEHVVIRSLPRRAALLAALLLKWP